MNVKTNVAKKFLTILDKCYQNRTNSINYSIEITLKSAIAASPISQISSHHTTEKSICNCREKDNCPLNGKCLDSQINYSCLVKTTTSDERTHYTGLTENIFKERCNQHKNSFKHEGKANSTELSTYVELKKMGTTLMISWEVIDHACPYNNSSKFCHLCAMENSTSSHQSTIF